MKDEKNSFCFYDFCFVSRRGGVTGGGFPKRTERRTRARVERVQMDKGTRYEVIN